MKVLLYFVLIDERFSAECADHVQFVVDNLDLDVFEKTRLTTVRNQTDLRQACVSYLFARWGISKLTNNQLLENIRIYRAGDYLSQKPRYVTPDSHSNTIDFNISHDKESCAGIFSDHGSVGIDIMHLDSRSDRCVSSFFDSMRRIFSDKEWNYVLPPISDIDNLVVTKVDHINSKCEQILFKELRSRGGIEMARFLVLWSTKEAYSKCLGKGLSLDPAKISIHIDSAKEIKVNDTSCTIDNTTSEMESSSEACLKANEKTKSMEELHLKGILASELFNDAWNNIGMTHEARNTDVKEDNQPLDLLAVQDVENLDVAKLTPVTYEVMSRQATINIGTIGHVAHGKSTVVRALSGVQTVRFKNEKERNITIKLGYANAKLYKCQNPDCPPPECYASYGSNHIDTPPCRREGCGGTMQTLRHVSFVDCPGHDILMATMLNGAAVMDAALLLIAGNESCPQPQTSEHLAAVEIMKLKHILVLQNKVELIKQDQCSLQQEQIKEFVKGTAADRSPVIPISAILRYNMDVVVEYLCTQVPVPLRDFTSSPEMIVIRSFDVNKPGESIENMLGGVAGGSILKGVLKVGDVIETRPGIVTKTGDDKFKVRPIRSRIVSLLAEQNELKYAVPGGLIGVGTNIDPTFTRADKLVGQVLGHPGAMPNVFEALEVKFYLLRRLIGIKIKRASKLDKTKKPQKVKPIEKGEFLMVNIGSTSVGGRVSSVKDDVAKFKLAYPVCTRMGDKVALSRRVEKNWRLIGWGEISRGTTIDLENPF